MIVVFLGPPGSGKGTQAKRWVEKGWLQLSTGDMLRAAISAGTKLGKEAKSYMDKGSLVPDKVVIGMISEKLDEAEASPGVIFDGFPRTEPQAKALDELLKTRKKKIDLAVLFKVDEDELIERLSGRRTCSKCGTMFHTKSAPSKKKDVCDECGSPLIQRDDDKAEVIGKRLRVYDEQTAPLIGFYQKQGKLKNVKASLAPDQVEEALQKLFRAAGK